MGGATGGGPGRDGRLRCEFGVTEPLARKISLGLTISLPLIHSGSGLVGISIRFGLDVHCLKLEVTAELVLLTDCDAACRWPLLNGALVDDDELVDGVRFVLAPLPVID